MNKNRKIFVIVIMAVVIIVIIFAIIKEQTKREQERQRQESEQKMTIHDGIPDWMYTGEDIPSEINESVWKDESASEEWIEIDLKYMGEVQGELQDEYSTYPSAIKSAGGFWYLITTEKTAKKEWMGIESWGVEVDYAQNYLVVSLGREIEHLYYKQDVIINFGQYETKVVFNEEQSLDNSVHVYIIDRLPIKDMGAGL